MTAWRLFGARQLLLCPFDGHPISIRVLRSIGCTKDCVDRAQRPHHYFHWRRLPCRCRKDRCTALRSSSPETSSPSSSIKAGPLCHGTILSRVQFLLRREEEEKEELPGASRASIGSQGSRPTHREGRSLGQSKLKAVRKRSMGLSSCLLSQSLPRQCKN